MVFLRSAPSYDQGPVLESDRLYLRLPQSVDYETWSSLRQISAEKLRPYEPEWADNELSKDAFRLRLRFYQREFRDRTGYPFFIFSRDDHRLIGGITLSNVRRGVTQSGSIGYWVGVTYQNMGYMTEAVRTLVRYGIKDLGLHRIDAASLPENAASIRVLEVCGFQKEGLARKFLRINGRWQDHFLYSFLEDDFAG